MKKKKRSSQVADGLAVLSGYDRQQVNLTLLQSALAVSVPLMIERWRYRSPEERMARATSCAQVVAEKGDVILFKSKKAGETGAAFNALAEGIALLAFAPGGVDIFGLHFDATSEL
jgi:hypothetical protein